MHTEPRDVFNIFFFFFFHGRLNFV